MNDFAAWLKSRLNLSYGSLFGKAQWLYTEPLYRLSNNRFAFPPRLYLIFPTVRCNMKCVMCQFAKDGAAGCVRDRQEEMTAEEWRRILDQIPRFSLVSFTGGEPLLRKDTIDLIQYAGKRAVTHLISNFTLVDDAVAERLIACVPKRAHLFGLRFLGISLHGPEAVHDRITAFPGAFSRAMEGLACLKRAQQKAGRRLPVVHISTVIQRENVDSLPEMPAIVAKAGVNMLNLIVENRICDILDNGASPSPECVRHEDIPPEIIPKESLRRALDACSEQARALGIQIRYPRMMRDDLLAYYAGEPFDLTPYECRNPWLSLGIIPNGNAGSCFLGLLGNLRENTLHELWNSEKQREFRRLCRKGLFQACAGCCNLSEKPAHIRARHSPGDRNKRDELE